MHIFPTKIIGHLLVKANLRHRLQNGNIPHALLISGPSQSGKTSLLIDFAKALQAGNNLNTNIFNEQESFKIDQVRKIQTQAYLTTEANYQIFIIKNIERMTIPASNALLKLLEEPPAKVKFFLTTSNEAQLLPTIKSRCQIIRTPNLTEQELVQFTADNFPQHKLEKSELLLALNRPGRLKQLLEDQDYYQTVKNWFQALTNLDDFHLSHHHFLLSKQLTDLKDRQQIEEFLTIYQTYLRHQIKNTKTDPHHWAQKLIYIQKTLDGIQSNQNPQLTLEHLFLQTTQN